MGKGRKLYVKIGDNYVRYQWKTSSSSFAGKTLYVGDSAGTLMQTISTFFGHAQYCFFCGQRFIGLCKKFFR